MASAIDFLPTISSCQAVSQMNLATARWRPHAGYCRPLLRAASLPSPEADANRTFYFYTIEKSATVALVLARVAEAVTFSRGREWGHPSHDLQKRHRLRTASRRLREALMLAAI